MSDSTSQPLIIATTVSNRVTYPLSEYKDVIARAPQESGNRWIDRNRHVAGNPESDRGNAEGLTS